MQQISDIIGKKIKLKSFTKETWHEFWKQYLPDPMMVTMSYSYDYNNSESTFIQKMSDSTRQYFSIIKNDSVIGEIYLKHIDIENQTSEFGVALINDTVKGKGYGTEAIELLITYSFENLNLKQLTATSVHRNVRSQHILQKLGFKYTHEDEKFKHYKLEK